MLLGVFFLFFCSFPYSVLHQHVVPWLTHVRSTGNSPDSHTWPVRSRTWDTQSRSGTSGFSLDWTRWNSCPTTSCCPTPTNPDRTTSPSSINSAMRYRSHVYTAGSRTPQRETQASKHRVGEFMHEEKGHLFQVRGKPWSRPARSACFCHLLQILQTFKTLSRPLRLRAFYLLRCKTASLQVQGPFMASMWDKPLCISHRER